MNFTPVDFDPFKDIDKIIPTSEPQREILGSVKFGNDAANCAYNESLSLKLSGSFNYNAIVKAANAVVARHGSLRATFIEEGVKMRIANSTTIDVPLIDISNISEAEQQAHLNEIIGEDVAAPFDLPNGPLFDVKVVKLSEQLHYVIITAHHIVCDGWSMGIVMQDISTFYNQIVTGKVVKLEDAIQFDDYVANEIDFEASPEYQATEQFWLSLFKDYNQVFELPTDKPRPALRSYNAKRIDCALNENVISQLRKAGGQLGCSLINTLIAAYEIFLFRLTKQPDIILGLPSAGQAVTDNYSLVGHCVNLLPLKTHVDGKLTFTEYLIARKKSLFDAFENQRYTFGTLIKKLNVPRDPSRIPLVPVAFNADLGLADGVAFENLNMELFSNPRSFENFEIFFNISGQNNQLVIECTYNTDLYDEELMQNRLHEFSFLLDQLAADMKIIINSIQLLPDIEQNILQQWNETSNKDYLTGTIQSLFENQVKRTPDNAAVEYKGTTYTYAQVDALANRIANYFTQSGLKQGQIVGLFINRSANIPIAMLGILKAGGVYLPIDPDFPIDRIEYMISNSGLHYMISENDVIKNLQFKINHVLLTDNWEDELPTNNIQPIDTYNEKELAYIRYTSGSTGLPKGVMVYNASLVNLINSFIDTTGFTATDILLAVTTVSFDIAELEMYMPLLTGGKIVIAAKDESADPRSLMKYLTKSGITYMQATPVTWRMLIEAGWQTSKLNVLCGGEALPVELAQQLAARATNVYNVYGPTETTVWSSVHKLPTTEEILNEGVKIGRPIANTTFYILDPQLNKVPIGVEGEIYIGGAGLAKGYLNRDDLTTERFIPSPFSDSQGQFIYKTGDIGRFNKNGNLECTGRSDFQVKVRGFRIELGEIETAINQIPEVSNVAVITMPDKNKENQLFAYVTEHELKSKSGDNHVNNWREKWDLIYDAGIKAIENQDVKSRKLDTAIAQQISGNEAIEVEVNEWLEQTIERIEQLKPKRVYEIGCGAGQVLFRIAPLCQYYVASDYAQAALDELKLKINADSQAYQNVTLQLATADDFTLINDGFDCIIINSVVQYFPNAAYLENVLTKCLNALAPGGCVFIGDVQSNMLIEMHHTHEQLHRIDIRQPVARLKRLIQNRIQNELELAIDIEYFEAIRLKYPMYNFAKYLMRKGRIFNETTKYHYDVVLFKETIPLPINLSYHPFNNDFDLQFLSDNLKQNQPFGIKNIPNKRLIKDKTALDLIEHSTDDLNCGIIIEQLFNLPQSIDPQNLFELAAESGFVAEIYWTDRIGQSSYDVAFIPKSFYSFNCNTQPRYVAIPVDLTALDNAANAPYKADQNQELINKIKQQLEKTLPHYMLPVAYKVLDKMPLTNNGKIDRNALPEIEVETRQNTQTHIEPTTETEKMLALVWEKLLNITHVGLNDNFFELGGHSIIAVRLMIEIEYLKKIRLPLAVLFTNPTLVQLAQVIDNEASGELWKSIIPISESGTKAPMYFAHGVSGNVFKYHTLGKLLDSSLPSYGLQARGLNGIDKPFSDLKEMAAYHTQEILKMQPEGPYFLGGGSFGGTLAYEIACQLFNMGKEIGFVALFDVEAATKSETLEGVEKQLVEIKLKSQRVVSRLKLLANQSMDDKLVYLKNKLNNKNPQVDIRKKQIDEWLEKDLIAEKYGTVSADYFNNVEENCYKALKYYNISTTQFHCILFRAKNGFYSPIEYENDLGWGNFAKGNLDVVYVPGNHNSIFDQPNVVDLAKELMTHVNKYYKNKVQLN